MPGTGSFARGDSPRSVPDPLAGPYGEMLAAQRAFNARQANDYAGGRLSAGGGGATSRQGEPLAARMYRPGPDDIAELRRQQAAFRDVEHELGRQNSWMAAPVLAPVAAVLGLEMAGVLAVDGAASFAEGAPLQFVERDPYLRVGDNWATRAGRRAHMQLKAKVEAKPGWKYEPRIPREGQRPLRPDAGAPQRDPANPNKRYFLELKPDTPSGRAAGARALRRYKSASKNKVRLILYPPEDFV